MKQILFITSELYRPNPLMLN